MFAKECKVVAVFLLYNDQGSYKEVCPASWASRSSRYFGDYTSSKAKLRQTVSEQAIFLADRKNVCPAVYQKLNKFLHRSFRRGQQDWSHLTKCGPLQWKAISIWAYHQTPGVTESIQPLEVRFSGSYYTAGSHLYGEAHHWQRHLHCRHTMLSRQDPIPRVLSFLCRTYSTLKLWSTENKSSTSHCTKE